MANGAPYPDLKACPCCGGEAKMEQTGRDKMKIQCRSCGIKREQRCWRYSMEWLEQKMAETWNRRALPEGMALVPRAITAETGHKAALMGEFSKLVEMPCPECYDLGETDDDCEICAGAGEYSQRVHVDWSTIKDIHRRVVEIAEREPS